MDKEHSKGLASAAPQCSDCTEKDRQQCLETGFCGCGRGLFVPDTTLVLSEKITKIIKNSPTTSTTDNREPATDFSVEIQRSSPA